MKNNKIIKNFIKFIKFFISQYKVYTYKRPIILKMFLTSLILAIGIMIINHHYLIWSIFVIIEIYIFVVDILKFQKGEIQINIVGDVISLYDKASVEISDTLFKSQNLSSDSILYIRKPFDTNFFLNLTGDAISNWDNNIFNSFLSALNALNKRNGYILYNKEKTVFKISYEIENNLDDYFNDYVFISHKFYDDGEAIEIKPSF